MYKKIIFHESTSFVLPNGFRYIYIHSCIYTYIHTDIIQHIFFLITIFVRFVFFFHPINTMSFINYTHLFQLCNISILHFSIDVSSLISDISILTSTGLVSRPRSTISSILARRIFSTLHIRTLLFLSFSRTFLSVLCFGTLFKLYISIHMYVCAFHTFFMVSDYFFLVSPTNKLRISTRWYNGRLDIFYAIFV